MCVFRKSFSMLHYSYFRMFKCYAEFEKAQEDETLRQLLPKSCDEFNNRNCISFIKEVDHMQIRDESKSNLFRILLDI